MLIFPTVILLLWANRWQLQHCVTATGAILASLGTLLQSREQTLLLLIHPCNLEDWIVDVIKTKIFLQMGWTLT